MAIQVTIEGAHDSHADFDDDTFIAADEAARSAIAHLYESGATVANVAEVVQGALEDAEAEAA
jgi:hypothetical protein